MVIELYLMLFTYAALAFVSQVYGDANQSRMFIANAKQLASSFFDEPSFDAGTLYLDQLEFLYSLFFCSAVAMTMIGQYWYNLTSDQVNASQYSSLGYSLSKYVRPCSPLFIIVFIFISLCNAILTSTCIHMFLSSSYQ